MRIVSVRCAGPVISSIAGLALTQAEHKRIRGERRPVLVELVDHVELICSSADASLWTVILPVSASCCGAACSPASGSTHDVEKEVAAVPCYGQIIGLESDCLLDFWRHGYTTSCCSCWR